MQKGGYMSYMQLAQLDILSAVNGINTEAEYTEFRDMIARYFAQKAQKAVDAMWSDGQINEQTIEDWGKEHMRTPYRHASHRS